VRADVGAIRGKKENSVEKKGRESTQNTLSARKIYVKIPLKVVH
jgi:hypothetical protein